MRRVLFFFAVLALVTSSFGAPPKEDMNPIAEKYAHLVLALGQHDPDYVDAFYGPPEWKTQAEKKKQSLDEIGADAAKLIEQLGGDLPSHKSPPRTPEQ